jgi:hypothetical protein
MEKMPEREKAPARYQSFFSRYRKDASGFQSPFRGSDEDVV